jgi:hypothetical protein
MRNVLVKVDSSVGELAEGSSLLDLSGLLGVLSMESIVSARSFDDDSPVAREYFPRISMSQVLRLPPSVPPSIS